MDKSIFTGKAGKPDDTALEAVLGITWGLWKELRDFVFREYPGAVGEWNWPGERYGWNYRISKS
ncbi:MAG: DUF3788 family protein [Bacteroidales bacterium]|nr:DUF3788 family protein [Bacteroidales bacterium]